MGAQIDKIKKMQELSPEDILAGLIWDRAVNSKDHVFKVPYYGAPCYIEYCHDNNSYTIDCLFLGQERSFMLIQPKYQQIRVVAPEILQWLQATYYIFAPPEPAKKNRRRRTPQAQPMVLPQRPQKARQNRTFRPQNRLRDKLL